MFRTKESKALNHKRIDVKINALLMKVYDKHKTLTSHDLRLNKTVHFIIIFIINIHLLNIIWFKVQFGLNSIIKV